MVIGNFKKYMLSISIFCIALIFLVGCGAQQDAFKVEFLVEGETYYSLDVSGNETIELPSNPSLTDYEFMGWYFDEDSWEDELTSDYYAYRYIFRDVKVYAYFKRVYSETDIYEKVKDAVFKVEILNKNMDVVSQGSGFFINEDGTFITNAHVVDDGWYGRIDRDSTVYDIDIDYIYHYNEASDYAILKLDDKYSHIDYPVVEFSEDYEIGDTVYSIGYPNNSYESKISSGVILSEEVISGRSYIMTSAEIDHGSSGGITVNDQGQVIGMSSIIIKSYGYGSIPVKSFLSDISMTYNNTQTLSDYFHPSVSIALNANNFEEYFYFEVDAIVVLNEYSDLATVYYYIQILPKGDYELSQFSTSISVSVYIEIEYSYSMTIDNTTYYDQTSDHLYQDISLYANSNLSRTIQSTLSIQHMYIDLESIDSYIFDISSVTGIIVIYI